MDVDKILKLIENCKTKYIYPIVTIVILIALMPIILSFNKASQKSWVAFAVWCIVTFILYLLVYLNRKLPKAKKDSFGILFSIDCDNNKSYELIRDKFIKVFQHTVNNEMDLDMGVKYEIVNLDKFNSDKYKDIIVGKDKEKIIKLLNKTNCKYIVYGTAIIGGEKENISCILDLESAITHPALDEHRRNILGMEMSYVFEPLSSINILKESESTEFKNNAIQLKYAFKYILATAVLMCDEVENGYKIFKSIEDVKGNKQTGQVINNIRRNIDNRISFCSAILASRKITEYYKEEDKALLQDAYAYIIDIVDSGDSIVYDKHMLSAIYLLFYKKDSRSALHEIEKCQAFKNRKEWKYSRVFLRLYNSDAKTNFLNAYRVYKANWNKLSIEQQNAIEDSIIVMLNQKPEKKQLKFLLCLIYYLSDEKELLNRYLTDIKKTYIEYMKDNKFSNIINMMEAEIIEKAG